MMCDKVVCEKIVCERWCVTKLCVTKLCVKDGVCVTKLCVKVVEEEREAGAGYIIKNKNPTQRCVEQVQPSYFLHL